MIHTSLYLAIKVTLMAKFDAPAVASVSVASASTADGGFFARALVRVRAVFA